MMISWLPSIFHSPQGIMILMYGTPWRGAETLPTQGRGPSGMRWVAGGVFAPPSYYKLPSATPTHPQPHIVDTNTCNSHSCSFTEESWIFVKSIIVMLINLIHILIIFVIVESKPFQIVCDLWQFKKPLARVHGIQVTWKASVIRACIVWHIENCLCLWYAQHY